MNNQRVIPVIADGEYKILLHIGGRSRYNTLTDVKYYNEDTLVASNRDKGLVYLISIKDPEPKILDTLQLRQGILPDLIDVYEDTVHIVILDGNVYTCKIENGSKLIYEGKISINDACKYHSVRVNPYNPNELWCCSAYKSPGILSIYNTVHKTCKNFPHVPGQKGYRLKDMHFLTPSLVIITGSTSSGKETPSSEPFDSLIYLYNWNGNDFTYLDGFKLDWCQSDGVAIKDNTIYVACQYNNRGVIIQALVENNKLKRLPDILTPDFPHGIGMSPSQKFLCYSAYSTSSIYIVPLE